MTERDLKDLYEQHVKPLPLNERLRLLAMTAEDLAEEAGGTTHRAKRNIMGLHGLGREIWQGVNVEEYINELRNEWDRDEQTD